MIQQIPAAEFIEAAVEELKNEAAWKAPDALKELHSAVGEKSADFQQGYLFGLEVAAVMDSFLPPKLKQE